MATIQSTISFCLGNKILSGDVSLRVRELVRQTCEAFEINILSGVVSTDQVHISDFCARGYFYVTVGQMTEEMIKNYLEHHFEANPNDNFKLGNGESE